MGAIDKPVTKEHVNCETCLKEVPLSEVFNPEASDYFVNFCGLACYEAWKARLEKSEEKTGT
ncbi:MAG: DUF3330 domain-containing protein [Rhodocyclaceae bacterium]|nr:DUF3330 domain-containing protein [Rhodocyclaceae bacterium]